MKNNVIAISILFSGLFFSFTLTANAQQPKEKKGIVYVDGIPQYKLEKAGSSTLQGVSYLVSSLANDALIRFNLLSISIPGLPHEDVGASWSYLQVEFVSLGKTVAIDNTDKKGIIKQLHAQGVINDGKVVPEGADGFIAAHQVFQQLHDQMEAAAIRRKTLAKDQGYPAYSKSLAHRPMYVSHISLSGDNIMLGTTMIGTWKVVKPGTSYAILKMNGQPAATVSYDQATRRTSTHTELDNLDHAGLLPAEFSTSGLIAGIKMLVLNGYL